MTVRGIEKKVVVSVEEVKEILYLYHSDSMVGAHGGLNNTLEKISRTYYWRGMLSDIKEYNNSCKACQFQAKIKTQSPVLQPIKVTRPLELVGMDLIGPMPVSPSGNCYCLTFTDYFSKFVVFFPLKSKAGSGVAQGLRTFICR